MIDCFIHSESYKLVSKYWPEGSKFIFDLGYKRTIFSGVYDLSKAKKEYHEQLISLLEYPIYEGFNQLYKDTKNLCQAKNII